MFADYYTVLSYYSTHFLVIIWDSFVVQPSFQQLFYMCLNLLLLLRPVLFIILQVQLLFSISFQLLFNPILN